MLLLSNVPPMVPGALVAMLGMLVLMILVFSSGGVAKSKQFGVLSDIACGRRGKTKRRVLVLGLVLTGLGTCGAFAGVAAGDRDRGRACERTCSDRGYAAAAIQGSTERNPPGSGKHAFVACVCTQGPEPDPLELRANSLRVDSPDR